MIALLLADRCTQCRRCVEVCPTNVFDVRDGALPAIARPLDCQTCYLCELYCRADALYVEPDSDRPVAADEATVRVSGLLGQFRRDSGWDEFAGDPRYANEHWRMEEVFARGRALAASGPPAARADASVVPLAPPQSPSPR